MLAINNTFLPKSNENYVHKLHISILQKVVLILKMYFLKEHIAL